MYFTANTPLFHYEIMMQRISNFLPRGHGIHVTVTQTPRTVDCEYCLFFKRKKCALPCCPYIEDKIRTGTATLQQIMDKGNSPIKVKIFGESKFGKKLAYNERESDCRCHPRRSVCYPEFDETKVACSPKAR